MNKIDIIIPVYNAIDSIENCLDSARKQTLRAIGIILVDDGSTDGSSDICDRFGRSDPRIKVLHIKNGGVSNARNMGLLNSSAEYIQFLDSDDYIDSNMCERLYDVAIQYNADVVACGFIYETNGVKVKQVKYKGVFSNLGELKESFGGFYTSGYAHVLWDKIYRKDCIKGCFNTDISIGEDLQFNLEVFRNISCLCCIEDCLYHYSFMNNIGLTRKRYDNYFELKVKEFEKAEKFAVEFLKCNKNTMEYLNSIVYRDINTILRNECQNGSFNESVCYWKNYLNGKYNKTKGIKSKVYRYLLLSFSFVLKALMRFKLG